jgi:hypothetical protein
MHPIVRTYFVMKTLLHITATVDQPDLLKDLVEKLAWRRNDVIISDPASPFKAFYTSSTEAYVSGSLAVEGLDEEMVNIPFITCFAFTCIRPANGDYKLVWSQSLS